MTLNKKKSINLINWLIVLCCFSYPITANLITILNVSSTPINIVLKTSFSILALKLIISSVFYKKRTLPKTSYPLIIFFIIYILRLISDHFFTSIRFADHTAIYVFSFYIGGIILPCFAILLNSKEICFERLMNLFLIFLSISNVITLFSFLFLGGLSIDSFSSGRAELINDTGNDPGSILNSISLAYYGGFSCIVVLVYFFIFKNKISFFLKYYLIVLFIISFLNLLLAASRGPLLSFLLISFFIIFVNFLFAHKNLIYFLKLSSFVTFFSLIFFNFLINLVDEGKLFAFQRLLDFFESKQGGNGEYRDLAFASAWQDFLSSPIFGKHFVGTYDNYYPHNFIIEVFMSTGIIGALPFFFIFGIIFSKLYFALKKSNRMVTVLFILLFYKLLTSLTSGSLFEDNSFWIFICLFLVIKFSDNYKEVNLNGN